MFASEARPTKHSRPFVAALLALACLVFVPRASAIDAGQSAPEIALTDFSGNPVSLTSLKGKVVVVDFWASWCKPCREELPVLEQLHKKYGANGLVVVGVNIDTDAKTAKKFLVDHKLTLSFPVVNDAKHKVAESYAPPTMPSSYVIDRSGKIRFVHAGYRASDAQKLEAEIKQLLN